MKISTKDQSSLCGSLILSMEPPTSRGKSLTSVSLACSIKGKIEHAVIIHPVTNDEYVASRGKGAQLNGRKIRVSQREQTAGSVFACVGRFPKGPVRDGHAKLCEAIDEGDGNSGAWECGALNSPILRLAASTVCGSDGSIFGISQPERSSFKKQAV